MTQETVKAGKGKCECWHEEHTAQPFASGRCSGTKEFDFCDCGGDVTKCDFYPDKRRKALEEKGKLKPCPLCGGDAKTSDTTTDPQNKFRFGWIGCQDCQVFINYINNTGGRKKAEDAWNRRVNDG